MFTMKTAVWILAIATLVTGWTSAWYWYQSAKVSNEHTKPDAKSIEMAALGSAAGTKKAFQEAAELNATGAMWTAVSVSLGAVTTFLGTL